MIEIQHILMPTDFSEPSVPATNYAVDLAKKYGATLHLLHVIEDPVVYVPAFESYPLPPKEDFEAAAQAKLDAWLLPEDAEAVDVKREWVHGSTARGILEFADELPADLIVMGTHGHGLAMQVLLGSVTERVVRSANCPVLTVRWHRE